MVIYFIKEKYSEQCNFAEKEFEKAAPILQDPFNIDDIDTIDTPIHLAKINCDENPKAMSLFDIRTFPTIVFFKYGV